MADRLARIFGTEEDKVNCPFYFKIGACRHGDTCTRLHNKPVISQTVLLPHLYENPPAAVAFADGLSVPDALLIEAINHFETFYEEVYMELAKFGEIEEMHVCDNIGEHLLGNVYAKFIEETEADKAWKGLNGRYYDGKQIKCEFSPVTDFKESRCRLYVEGQCDRGGYCNFMHLKHLTKEFRQDMKALMYQEYPEYFERRQKRKKEVKKSKTISRSKSPSIRGEKSNSRSWSKTKDKKKKHHKHKSSSSSSNSKSKSKSPGKRDHKRNKNEGGDGAVQEIEEEGIREEKKNHHENHEREVIVIKEEDVSTRKEAGLDLNHCQSTATTSDPRAKKPPASFLSGIADVIKPLPFPFQVKVMNNQNYSSQGQQQMSLAQKTQQEQLGDQKQGDQQLMNMLKMLQNNQPNT